jgi:acyl-coenzyme A synthetase/AMP-(fatty) acid ligase
VIKTVLHGLTGPVNGTTYTQVMVPMSTMKDVKRVTAPYKYPREIEFVDSLPKTISGKIRRLLLDATGLDLGKVRLPGDLG